MITQLIKTRSLTNHNVDCSSSHRIWSSNTDHLRDERAEADSRLAHRGWEHLHGLFCRRIKWKQMENNKNRVLGTIHSQSKVHFLEGLSLMDLENIGGPVGGPVLEFRNISTSSTGPVSSTLYSGPYLAFKIRGSP